MVLKLNLSSLRDRRIQAKLLMMYKIIHQLVCIPDDFLTPKYPSLRRGYFAQPDTRVDCFKFSFFPSVIKLWNLLPLCNQLSHIYSVCINIIITPVRYNHIDFCTVYNTIQSTILVSFMPIIVQKVLFLLAYS